MNSNKFSTSFIKIVLFDILIKLFLLIIPNIQRVRTDTNLFSAFAYLFLIEFLLFIFPYYVIAKIYLSIIRKINNAFNIAQTLAFSVLLLFTIYLLVYILFFRNEWPTSQVAFFLINGILMGAVFWRFLGKTESVV